MGASRSPSTALPGTGLRIAPERTCDIGSRGVTAYATGRLMGTDCQIRATHSSSKESLAAVDAGWVAVAECERLWSRFRPDSELCRINSLGDGGILTAEVSELTVTLIAAMKWAYSASGGWVDASLLPQVIAAGYDRDFQDLAANVSAPSGAVQRNLEHGTLADVFVSGNQVTLARPVQLDSGGVGKGLAADLVADSIMRNGALGALVNLGGDIRAIGSDQHARPWSIHVADERGVNTSPLTSWEISDSAVATSSVARRRWNGGHHLIDPRTWKPSQSDVLAATVGASDALAAEVAAKTALLMGLAAGSDWLAQRGTTAVLTGTDGSIHWIGTTE